MIDAVFTENENIITTKPITQYDKGLQLALYNLTSLVNPQVQFFNKKSTEAINVTSIYNDELDAYVVDVPNLIVSEPYDVYASIYETDGATGQTIGLVNIPLKKRIKPQDYTIDSEIDGATLVTLSNTLRQIQSLMNKSLRNEYDGSFVRLWIGPVEDIPSDKEDGVLYLTDNPAESGAAALTLERHEKYISVEITYPGLYAVRFGRFSSNGQPLTGSYATAMLSIPEFPGEDPSNDWNQDFVCLETIKGVMYSMVINYYYGESVKKGYFLEFSACLENASEDLDVQNHELDVRYIKEYE